MLMNRAQRSLIQRCLKNQDDNVLSNQKKQESLLRTEYKIVLIVSDVSNCFFLETLAPENE